MIIKAKSKNEIERLIETLFNGMSSDEDYFGCEPACRRFYDTDNEYHCDICYKDELKRYTYILDNSDNIHRKDDKWICDKDEELDMVNFIDNLSYRRNK